MLLRRSMSLKGFFDGCRSMSSSVRRTVELLIAPGALGGVEQAIGAKHQGIEIIGVAEHHAADGDRELQVSVGLWEADLTSGSEQALAKFGGAFVVRFRQQHDKFLAAGPADQVGAT